MQLFSKTFAEYHRPTMMAVAILVVAFCIILWSVDYLPLSDYPSHLLGVQIVNQLDNPDFGFDRYFVVDYQPLPNLGSQIVIGLLSRIVSIDTAGRLYLTIFSLLFIISIFYFLHQVDTRKTWLGILSLLFVFNWYFHQGYINFWGSVPLYFFSFGYWLGAAQKSSTRTIIVSLCLFTALYFFHLFSWLILFGSLSFMILFNRESRSRLMATMLSLLPSLGLVLYYLLVVRSGSATSDGPIFYGPVANLMFGISHTFANFSQAEVLIYIAPIALLVFLCGLSLIKKTHILTRTEKQLFWIAGSLAILYFVLPRQIASVWPFNLRVNLFVIFLLTAAIPVEIANRFRNWFVALVSVCALISFSYTFLEYQKQSNSIETYLSGIDQVEPASTILPLCVDISGGWEYHIPLSTVWAYYHIEKGGAGPYLFNLPHGQIVSYRDPKREVFPAPSLYPHRVEQFSASEHAAPYDYVILFGSQPELESEILKRFRLIFTNGSLKLFRILSVAAPI